MERGHSMPRDAPIDTSLPMVTLPRDASTTERSCKQLPLPTTTLPPSPACTAHGWATVYRQRRPLAHQRRHVVGAIVPRTVAPYHTEARSPSVTAPTTLAVGATNASNPCFRVLSPTDTTRVDVTTDGSPRKPPAAQVAAAPTHTTNNRSAPLHRQEHLQVHNAMQRGR